MELFAITGPKINENDRYKSKMHKNIDVKIQAQSAGNTLVYEIRSGKSKYRVYLAQSFSAFKL